MHRDELLSFHPRFSLAVALGSSVLMGRWRRRMGWGKHPPPVRPSYSCHILFPSFSIMFCLGAKSPSGMAAGCHGSSSQASARCAATACWLSEARRRRNVTDSATVDPSIKLAGEGRTQWPSDRPGQRRQPHRREGLGSGINPSSCAEDASLPACVLRPCKWGRHDCSTCGTKACARVRPTNQDMFHSSAQHGNGKPALTQFFPP